MALLLCYFAIPVLQGALTTLGGLHYFLPYAWEEFLATMSVQPQYYGVATGAGIFLVQAAIFATLFILLRKR